MFSELVSGRGRMGMGRKFKTGMKINVCEHAVAGSLDWFSATGHTQVLERHHKRVEGPLPGTGQTSRTYSLPS